MIGNFSSFVFKFSLNGSSLVRTITLCLSYLWWCE